jgi:hypothetical protein
MHPELLCSDPWLCHITGSVSVREIIERSYNERFLAQICREAAIYPITGNPRQLAYNLIIVLHRPHCNKNPINVFLLWELHGLSPNFHIHVFVGNLYIPRIGPHVSLSRIGRSMVGNI